MQAKDEIRHVSSLGGMFTILADYIFERGGFVCGAAFNKNENWKVEHIIIDKKEDLYKLIYSMACINGDASPIEDIEQAQKKIK